MYHICGFYQFTDFPAPDALRPRLRALCEEGAIIGTILVAKEGINGTIAARSRDAIARLIAHIRTLNGCADMTCKMSFASKQPFKRLKIRLKREIIAMGDRSIPVGGKSGDYVDPQDWNSLIAQDSMVVIDTRNEYEVALGSFRGAINPGLKRFGDFPAWWDANKSRFAGKPIAMFCTGGIRCEKSTHYLREQGVKELYHLRGGIETYLANIEPENSLWDGECYVFDGRVSVGHGLSEGRYKMCHACGRALAPEDLKKEEYQAGVQCHRCKEEYSDSDRARFSERHRQLKMAPPQQATTTG